MAKKEENAQISKAIGSRVRSLREQLRLSRKELSEFIDISEYFLIEIESGRKGVSNFTLCKLSEALHASTDYILTGRKNLSDTSEIVSMLLRLDTTLIKGAEDLLITYLNTVSYLSKNHTILFCLAERRLNHERPTPHPGG